jgi:small subunit ribosomal protein S4
MARDTRSIVKMSRREGYALHPKAHKALVKRSGPPGQHGGRNQRIKTSQYALQLREKQKVKRLYGLLEKQFSNLIYRSGFGVSRRAARQLVSHGHFTYNGRRVDIPSIRVKVGDEIKLRDHSKNSDYFKRLDDVSPAPSAIPSWLKVNRKQFLVNVTGAPTRDDSEPDIKEQLIVEYYSR